MDIKIRQYAEEDVKETIAIWNEVVKEGIAFPQKETLTESTGDLFFKEQTFTGIAYDEEKKEIVGMYILHPNNILKKFGFRILQLNAVVKSNAGALKLYEKLGFVRLGTIPKGFEMNDGHYEDIIPHYHEL